ncbi:MAG: heavy metal-binding domain-containing protein [Anaerolineaceae bacterium]|nr:heavy metal-binding domain-containing protein [Anaerolineaceae bacterium]
MANNESIEGFTKQMNKEDTSYLKRIWSIHDPSWSDEKLEVIGDILISRGESLAIPKRLLIKKMFLSTTALLVNVNILRYLGIDSAEVVLGTGLFSEFDAAIADFEGERSNSFQKKLQKAKDDAIYELCEKAADKGGNGVIGIKFDINSLDNNILMVFVSGTIVELEKIE